MKAWVLHQANDIRYEDVDIGTDSGVCGLSDEVLVRVRATGICGSDIPRIYETGAHNMPIIPGHEFSGEVAEGSRSLIGKRVGVYPLIPCRQCSSCLQDRYELCKNYDYIGSRRDGAFAEYVSVPTDNLIELPDSVSYEVAAMLEPMAVAVHAMRRGLKKLDEADKNIPIAVCGLGTIGLLLVMFLIEAGYHNLYLIYNKQIQKNIALDIAGESSVDVKFCNSSCIDVNDWLTDKICIYFECVGSETSLQYGLDNLASGGRLVSVGNPRGDMNIPKDVYWKILRNQLEVIGTWNSTFFPSMYHGKIAEDVKNSIGASYSLTGDRDKPDDWHYVLDRIVKNKIHPEKIITHRFSLDDLDRGIIMMRDKTEEYAKVMIV